MRRLVWRLSVVSLFFGLGSAGLQVETLRKSRIGRLMLFPLTASRSHSSSSSSSSQQPSAMSATFSSSNGLPPVWPARFFQQNQRQQYRPSSSSSSSSPQFSAQQELNQQRQQWQQNNGQNFNRQALAQLQALGNRLEPLKSLHQKPQRVQQPINNFNLGSSLFSKFLNGGYNNLPSSNEQDSGDNDMPAVFVVQADRDRDRERNRNQQNNGDRGFYLTPTSFRMRNHPQLLGDDSHAKSEKYRHRQPSASPGKKLVDRTYVYSARTNPQGGVSLGKPVVIPASGSYYSPPESRYQQQQQPQQQQQQQPQQRQRQRQRQRQQLYQRQQYQQYQQQYKQQQKQQQQRQQPEQDAATFEMVPVR